MKGSAVLYLPTVGAVSKMPLIHQDHCCCFQGAYPRELQVQLSAGREAGAVGDTVVNSKV